MILICQMGFRFQSLLSILDSPLNKAGRLRNVYIRTEKGVLIEVKPFVRIPRTFKRFAGVMCKSWLFLFPWPHFFWEEKVISFHLLLLNFCYPAVELLQKLSISAVGKREKLLRTIKNPVTQYLPVNSRKIGVLFALDCCWCLLVCFLTAGRSQILLLKSLFNFCFLMNSLISIIQWLSLLNVRSII